MSDRATHWDNVYATKGEAEVSWFQDNPAISLEMIRATNPDRGAEIIDIGGGASRLVDALLQDGYRHLTILDLSANALEASKKRIGAAASTVDWIVADATSWRPARTYDVWHDRAAFHFLTDPHDRTAYVERLRIALAPGGQVIIATFAPDGPEKCSGLPVQRTTTRVFQWSSGRNSSWSKRTARPITRHGIRRRRFSSADFGDGPSSHQAASFTACAKSQ